MVSKKRLNCGFNGYRAPIIPKAPRSIRRRGAYRDLFKDSKLCAFDLLAAVAGKLLQETESSTSSNVAEGKVQLGVYQDETEKQQFIDDKASKSESLEHGSYAESAFVPKKFTQERHLLSSFKGLSQAENDSVSERTSLLASSDILKKVDYDVKLGSCEVKHAGGNATSKVGDSICEGDKLSHKVVCGPQIHSEDDKNHLASISNVKDHIEDYVNTDVLINPENSVQLPLYRDPIPDALLQKHWNNVKVGIRDDDDNSFGCNKSSTKIRPFRPQPRIGHRRIRKMLALKYRKATSKLKGRGLQSPGEGMKSFYRYRKRIYTLERCQQAPVKKRKLSDHIFAVACDQDTSCNSISNLPEKGMGIDKSSSPIVLERADGTTATALDHQKAKDSHVKFSIKSFRVPELYIEVPENASVGSLKRTVMEAATSILGCGINIGVVLQGKKVRDDNKTLQQAGISESSDLDTLGFMLEPRFTHVSPSTTCKKLPSSSSHVADQQLLRSAGTPTIDSGIFRPPGTPMIDPPPLTKCDDDVGNNEFLSSPRTPKNEIMDAAGPDSKALVPAPPMKAEALAVVPVNPKPKRNELSQRRTRRPFSVAEVEALVEAVEKLGTGRWRDVKIGAFENADHRTYVDLKDKWKTLVHTATISPQQRRGEPVPQELLDRVLSAHSYWSQHQMKQHGKHPVEPLKTAVVDRREEVVRA